MFKIAVYLKPYKKEAIIGPIFKLMEAILELILPTIVALIINNGVGNHDSAYVYRMGGLMVLMSLLGFGCSMVCQYYAARASQGFGTTLRNKMFRHITSLSYAELDTLGTPTLINRITNDVNQLQIAVAMLIRLVIRAPFICIGAILMSMILDFRLSLILIAATPVFGIILYFIITRSAPLYRKYQQKLDALALVLSENLSGIRVIRAFAKRRTEKERFDASSDDLTTTAIRVSRISALLGPMTTLVVNAAIIAILWVGGIHIDGGRLSQGEIIAFINYITQILLALIVVSNLVIIFTKASSSANRVNEVLGVKVSVSEEGNALIAEPAPAAPAIQFDHVSFGYNTTGESALEDISLVINRGETVGLIGSTGSGKSTFVNLIPRFYDVVQGEVKVDGVDVRDYKLHQLREKIGIVPQKAVLFTGTIAENIRWGKEDATEEEIMQAASIAQAEEFIRKLPEGLNTQVSRGGLNLSGGQKQRLTIARAVVGKPSILILDDSSSALDFSTDAALRKALKESSQEMTVLLVSQRVSTVRQADKIMVFEEGRIAGVGTHEELMRGCEEYKEICLSQLSSEESGQ
ncbi:MULTISPECIES: ABC transporter ATP-binding protein [Paenibacillus]|uniref:ABC transporter ATP-binding protein n=1 Tax=Paenibacillus TaxID=44249 RepID=UPI00096FCC62|nr:ABC transporter ATP-binding protein [Paenibacillus odorifer]MEC0133275.1 ABC transporter ATP-binding protein [Paenibacillus odorifer]MEC0223308.1 ABC transporter ATP-binding protein [Paenibacillus odorifer]OMC94802.1 ATP-binding protein [Paenibacillus odorifer]OMC95221.1 ATP-binding protein [Paenibacillus odorifer]OME31822.1 ATP-binding protein [Paenibacillus odorifer]